MANQKTIHLNVSFIEVVSKKDGKTYHIPKIVSKKGNMIDCRFTRECNFIPESDCTIELNEDDFNLNMPEEKGKFWCYYIRHIIRVLPKKATEEA